MTHHSIASANFSKKTLRALSGKNLFIVSSTWITGDDGTYMTGETAYLLSNGKLMTFLDVLKLAA